MTYRCAILGTRHLGIPEHPEPAIYCDGCGLRLVARTRSGGPPAWLLNGKAPRGWRVERTGLGLRRDWCPTCKAKPRATFECDHCGCVAFEVLADAAVGDGDGVACMSCAWPGHVVLDSETPPEWMTEEGDADTACSWTDCGACR